VLVVAVLQGWAPAVGALPSTVPTLSQSHLVQSRLVLVPTWLQSLLARSHWLGWLLAQEVRLQLLPVLITWVMAVQLAWAGVATAAAPSLLHSRLHSWSRLSCCCGATVQGLSISWAAPSWHICWQWMVWKVQSGAGG
jgi:hypothetical protein